jgi:hypothetical protein
MLWLVGLAVLLAGVGIWRVVEHLTLRRLQRDAGITDDDFKLRDPTPRELAASLFEEGKSVVEVRKALLARGVAPVVVDAILSDMRPRRQRSGEAEQRGGREVDAYEASLQRGHYDANGYVALGAALQMAVVGGLVGGFATAVAYRLSGGGDVNRWIFFGVGLPVGFIAAIITYRGRWQRVEIYASRYCSGIINLSMLYVPLIAFVHANVLLVRDLASKGAGRVAREALDPPRGPEETAYTAPQVAGSPCTHCRQRIVSHLEGTLCNQCQQPVHRACRKDHRANAHPKPTRAAYR